MKQLRQLIFIFLCAGCTEPDPHNDQIFREAYNFLIRSEIRENEEILFRLYDQVEYNSSKGARILNIDEMRSFNKLAFSCIDTTLNTAGTTDDLQVRQFADDEHKYLKALESLVVNNVNSGIFRETESEIFKNWYKNRPYLKVLKPTFFFDEAQANKTNRDLRTLYLKCHNALLSEIYRNYVSYNEGGDGFIRLNVVLDRTSENESLSIQVNLRNEVWIPLQLIDIGNDSAYISNQRVRKDLLILTAKKFPKGIYYPTIVFKRIKHGGQVYRDTLKLRFFN